MKTPIMWKTKGEVVSLGSKYSIPFELTYSCYEGTEIHCGECSTCISRQVAFEEARVDDPTEYTVQSLREKTFHG
jgi:7-cyano-7-deazaguanine synthase